MGVEALIWFVHKLKNVALAPTFSKEKRIIEKILYSTKIIVSYIKLRYYDADYNKVVILKSTVKDKSPLKSTNDDRAN